jgi:hypothetical protein
MASLSEYVSHRPRSFALVRTSAWDHENKAQTRFYAGTNNNIDTRLSPSTKLNLHQLKLDPHEVNQNPMN